MPEARVIRVIETTLTTRGNGKDTPLRYVVQYWTTEGTFLAEHDTINGNPRASTPYFNVHGRNPHDAVTIRPDDEQARVMLSDPDILVKAAKAWVNSNEQHGAAAVAMYCAIERYLKELGVSH